MSQYTGHDHPEQIPLALGSMNEATTESALRAAYNRLDLSKRFSFEQAMFDPALAIGIRNLAEAILRRRASGHSSTRTTAGSAHLWERETTLAVPKEIPN